MQSRSSPISVNDIVALSTSDAPVTLVTSRSRNLEDVIGHGWLAGTEIQPGLFAYAAEYVAFENYSIRANEISGAIVALYLGDGHRAHYDGVEERLSHGDFSMTAFDRGAPIVLHRGEQKAQLRCSVRLTRDWINSDFVEKLDDRIGVRKILSRSDLAFTGQASPHMLSAAARLFSAAFWDGPLAGLRREAAAFAFLSEAVARCDNLQMDSASPNISLMVRVKELLDNMPAHADVRLADIAIQFGISVRSLCRHFRKAFDTTVLEYVVARRMDRARIALELDEVTIEQAAYNAGYTHTSNFSAAFTRRFGYPPGSARPGLGRR